MRVANNLYWELLEDFLTSAHSIGLSRHVAIRVPLLHYSELGVCST